MRRNRNLNISDSKQKLLTKQFFRKIPDYEKFKKRNSPWLTSHTFVFLLHKIISSSYLLFSV